MIYRRCRPGALGAVGHQELAAALGGRLEAPGGPQAPSPLVEGLYQLHGIYTKVLIGCISGVMGFRPGVIGLCDFHGGFGLNRPFWCFAVLSLACLPKTPGRAGHGK